MYRDQRRRPEQERDPSAQGSRLRIGTILVIGAAAAFALWASAGKSGPRKPPPPEALGSISVKRVTEHVADHGVVGGAMAAEKELFGKTVPQSVQLQVGGRTTVTVIAPGPTITSVPTSPTLEVNPRSIRLGGIRSVDSHETPEAAKEDAILQAQEKLREQFALMEPPISIVPSTATIRENYLRPGSLRMIEPTQADREAWAAANIDPNRVWASVDVEIGEDGFRTLRGESRLRDAALCGGILMVVVGVLFSYLKLDGITKGWLSVGLGVTAIGLASVVVAVLICFVRQL